MRLHGFARTALATAAAVVLLADTAAAHSGHGTTFSAGNYGLGATTNYTIGFTFGSVEADTMTIDLSPGFKLAHNDFYGNELASNPNDEDSIGSGTVRASWSFLFCGVSTVNVSLSWEDDMAGAPINAVAHYQAVLAGVGTYDIWAIEQDDATDNYKLTVDLDQAWTCSSSSQPFDANFLLTINGLAGGGVVSRSPSTSGCYGVKVSVAEVGGTYHDGIAGRDFPGGTPCTPTTF